MVLRKRGPVRRAKRCTHHDQSRSLVRDVAFDVARTSTRESKAVFVKREQGVCDDVDLAIDAGCIRLRKV